MLRVGQSVKTKSSLTSLKRYNIITKFALNFYPEKLFMFVVGNLNLEGCVIYIFNTIAFTYIMIMMYFVGMRDIEILCVCVYFEVYNNILYRLVRKRIRVNNQSKVNLYIFKEVLVRRSPIPQVENLETDAIY